MNEELLCGLMTVLGYLLGAIPFGIVVSRRWVCPIHERPGARTSALPTSCGCPARKPGAHASWRPGEGWVLAWAAMHWLTVESYIMVVALAPILGHLFSPFLGFKGGKGVATAVGVVLGLSPSIGLLLLLIWLGAVAIWRYSSGGALAAFTCFPIVAIVNEQRQEFFIFSLFVSALIWFKHKDNIVRLWRGTESKIGKKKQELEE
jgi:glycerol-3-phosphate acyltransferase PlsY